ncbi:SAM-dependent methyltransferase [Corynebacterium breve]|uniref:SAM-dependent methyltransferase n=1 Tax=Corynebacterium breve TaxID=3049799 RepID=A0ABY8VHL7_9CORY|nr:SAM-dependent methyltransferase [Corynebacterium breve]WIM68567.1 SAM-dependent methyltransferase [Corynebacterium breve]
MLNHVIDLLADPADLTPLSGADDFSRLVSESGHSFDVAKQGYVTLAAGAGIKHQGDDAAMVAARETFLSQGHFAPFVEAVTDAVHEVFDETLSDEVRTPAILEVGAGTGYYLSHTLDDVEGAVGIGLDTSVPAAKLLAKAHPRIGAVVADVWQRLPIRNNVLNAITVVFAPRNPAEFARVLADDGQVVVLTADPGHLDELRDPLGILSVEDGKVERMIEQAAGYLAPVGDPELIEFPMTLDRDSIAAQVGMSPSARHIDPADLAVRLSALPDTMTVTARAQLTRLAKS